MSVAKYIFCILNAYSDSYSMCLTIFFRPLKTRSVPVPSPFFSPESKGWIQDNYKGEYVDLARKIIPYKATFIFYYAPWDSESVDAKSEILQFAKHFQLTRPDLIKFYGVNCWWPDGQCRQNYKSLSHYPILVVHVGSHSVSYSFAFTYVKNLSGVSFYDVLCAIRVSYTAVPFALKWWYDFLPRHSSQWRDLTRKRNSWDSVLNMMYVIIIIVTYSSFFRSCLF